MLIMYALMLASCLMLLMHFIADGMVSFGVLVALIVDNVVTHELVGWLVVPDRRQ